MARSAKQKEHARASMSQINSIYPNSGNKENNNCSPGSSNSNSKPIKGSSVSKSAARLLQGQLADAKRVLNNTRCRLKRSQDSNNTLQDVARNALSEAETSHEKVSMSERLLNILHKAKNTYRMRDRRAPDRINAAVEVSQSHALKEKGIFTESVREMTRDLTAVCRVPIARVNDVIHTVARGLGMSVEGSIDKHSVARITLEAGVGAEMQIVHEIHNATTLPEHEKGMFSFHHISCIIAHIFIGLTVSGDGTTDKHLNLESKHGLLLTPTYASDPNTPAMSTVPSQRFFGINWAPDHKSETQLKGWQELIDRMYKVYNESPLGRQKPLNPLEFARLVTGMNTDHAEDQKKLFRLFLAWKESCEREMRGEEALLAASLSDILPFLWRETENNISAAGGYDAWMALAADKREKREVKAYKRICVALGADKLGELRPEECQYAALFIWGGCCMHKEMNSVKGGNVRMMAFWAKNNLPGPKMLFNKDNQAAARLSGGAAGERATEVSTAGGVKLTSLAGAVFANKDLKKGQQDTLQVTLQDEIGYMVRFPGTSSTRYRSHAEVAAELLVLLDFYKQFLEVVRDLKEKRNLTNIEQNIYNGLCDIPTLTELAVLVLYAQAITHPYMHEVRGPTASKTNLLDLGSLHDKVMTHCRNIISNPDLLLSTSASYLKGSLDGLIWHRLDVFYAVQALAPSLPHLCGAMVAFFEGALETWDRFTIEYRTDGAIARASATEKRRAFMLPTNDDNEGALGGKRVATRHAPNQTLEAHNSRVMYRKNNTAAFMRKCLTLEDRRYIRRKAREIDSSGAARIRREAQAAFNKNAVGKKRKADTERRTKAAAKRARIDTVNPRFDAEAINANPGTIPQLDLELDWHRLHDTIVPLKSHISRKSEKIKALLEAVDRHNSGQNTLPVPITENTIQEDVPSDLDEEESDFE
jgi:hypothetical protein